MAGHPPGSPEPDEKGRERPLLMGTIYRRSAARRDLITHFVYLSENAGEAVAERFLTQTETSLSELSDHPLIGSLLNL